jgi:cell division protein FtsB
VRQVFGPHWKKHDKTASTGFEKRCLDQAPHLYLASLFPVNFSKVIQVFFAVVFIAITLWATAFFVQMHRELKTMRAQEAENRQRLAEAEARLAQQEKYLDRLKHDPALVEVLIRQKLGYAKGDEFVFRFEEEKK